MRHITIRAALCALAITGCLIPASFAEEPAAVSATQTASEDSQPVDMTSALLRGLESTLPTVEQKVQQGDYAQAESRLRERQAQEAAYKEAQAKQAAQQKAAEEAAKKAAAKAAAEEAARKAKEPPSVSQRTASGLYQGTAAVNYDLDGSYTEQAYTSKKNDENALRVTYARIAITNSTISKTGGNSTSLQDTIDSGLNAAFLGTGNSGTDISTTKISSSAPNAIGAFSYGKSTFVRLTDSSVTTSGTGSAGVEVAGGGKLSAINTQVSTSGTNAPAINTGTNGGIITVEGGSYATTGADSPVIRAAGSVTSSKSSMTSAKAEAVRVIGTNAVILSQTSVDSTGAPYGVLMTSTSKEALSAGNAEFTMSGGSLTSHSGDGIVVTNTKATIHLTNNATITPKDGSNLLTVTANDGKRGWGYAGSNGGEADVFFDNTTLSGNISVDQYSRMNLILQNNSTFTGTINLTDNSAVTAKASEIRAAASADTSTDSDADTPSIPDVITRNRAEVVVGAGSTWNLTADAHISSLMCMGTINYNGHQIVLADGTVMTGAEETTAETEN